MYSKEQLTDEFAVRREQLMRRADELRHEFSDRVDEEVVTNFAGWTMISAGTAWGVTRWLRGSRSLSTLLLPIGFIVAGAALLGGPSMWHRRATHISEAEMRVREELASLDPLARMRVLRDTAEESMPLIHHLKRLRN